MTTAAIATRPASNRRAVIAAQVVFALFLVLRVAFFVMAQPNGDETYYWIWGQYPALSYYDHPPLLAWLQGTLSILGWSTWSLRAGTWLTLSGVLALFWLWARRLAPEAPALPFWRMSARAHRPHLSRRGLSGCAALIAHLVSRPFSSMPRQALPRRLPMRLDIPIETVVLASRWPYIREPA